VTSRRVFPAIIEEEEGEEGGGGDGDEPAGVGFSSVEIGVELEPAMHRSKTAAPTRLSKAESGSSKSTTSASA